MKELVGGLAMGAVGLWGLSRTLTHLGRDPGRPPELYEFFLDNFWFKAAEFEEAGALQAAISEEHAKHLEKECETYKSMGFDAEGLRIDHAWGGTMGFTLDFVPSVGVMGEHKNIYYGVAYNGHGVVFGQTAGRIISELIAGESSRLTDLFVVNHKIPYAGPSSLRILFARLYKEYLKRWGSNTTR